MYTKPSCVRCTSTYRELDSQGVEYEVLDVSSNPAALERFKLLKGTEAPLVVTPWGNWTGFRPDLITSLAAMLRQEERLREVAKDHAMAAVDLIALINQSNARSAHNGPLFTPPQGEPDEFAYPAPIPN